SIIDDLKPDIVSMENVPNLLNYEKGEVFTNFLSVLYANNYTVEFDVVDAKNFGVPQQRKRLILIASRLGPVNLPK
ncbi:DNA cytosine methyltransferase, partial [Rhizobium leguminosarum]|uniref:DNA cytosine methyltransferase n=1 Tax=Rhizobium leguminosarum TaxID=384 RepID=UPI003F9DB17F